MSTCKTKQAIQDMFNTIFDEIVEEVRLSKMQGYCAIRFSPYIDSPFWYIVEGDLFEAFYKADEERTREEVGAMIDFVSEIVRKELDDIIRNANND